MSVRLLRCEVHATGAILPEEACLFLSWSRRAARDPQCRPLHTSSRRVGRILLHSRSLRASFSLYRPFASPFRIVSCYLFFRWWGWVPCRARVVPPRRAHGLRLSPHETSRAGAHAHTHTHTCRAPPAPSWPPASGASRHGAVLVVFLQALLSREVVPGATTRPSRRRRPALVGSLISLAGWPNTPRPSSLTSVTEVPANMAIVRKRCWP